MELDEEELQRQLYRLEEVLKREEEIAQAMEGEVDVEEDESQLRRLEEDCMAMSDLQEREDVYRREKRRCEEEVSFLTRQVELREKRKAAGATGGDASRSPGCAHPAGSHRCSLEVDVDLRPGTDGGADRPLALGIGSHPALFCLLRLSLDEAAGAGSGGLGKWEVRRRRLEEDWNRLQQEAKADGAEAEKWDTNQMLQDARNHLSQLESELDGVLREQEAILRRWDADSPLDLYRKRDRIQERIREAEWARSAREKNRSRLAELRREAESWSEPLLERLGPFDPEEWHASLSQVLREAREVKERVRRLRTDLETLRADSSRWEAVRAEAVRRLQPWFERLGTDQFSEWEEWFLRSERVRELDEQAEGDRGKGSPAQAAPGSGRMG